MVLGLPRGGVPVAFEVAPALGAPLDVIVVRKLGVPFQPELAMGAIGEDGVRVVNEEVVRLRRVSRRGVRGGRDRERAGAGAAGRRFRDRRPRVSLAGRTGARRRRRDRDRLHRARGVPGRRAHGAARVVLAAPVRRRRRSRTLSGRRRRDRGRARRPSPSVAIGQFYDDFAQTTDDEVVASSTGAARSHAAGRCHGSGADPPLATRRSRSPAGAVASPATSPSRSGRRARRVRARQRQQPAQPAEPLRRRVLQPAGLGTLLFDLLTPEEELDRANVFDIELLAGRLVAVTAMGSQPSRTRADCPIGYFGASTGAAAALWAAAEPAADIAAVVSRGGRPDLAGPALAAVRAPTLLIVGGDDDVVLELNREARPQLRCERPICASCRARRTSSRSRARSVRRPSWPGVGSLNSSPRRCPTSPPRRDRVDAWRAPQGVPT